MPPVSYAKLGVKSPGSTLALSMLLSPCWVCPFAAIDPFRLRLPFCVEREANQLGGLIGCKVATDRRSLSLFRCNKNGKVTIQRWPPRLPRDRQTTCRVKCKMYSRPRRQKAVIMIPYTTKSDAVTSPDSRIFILTNKLSARESTTIQ